MFLSLHAADQDITFQLIHDIRHGQAAQLKFRQELKFQQLYPSLGKRIPLNGGRETQEPGYLHGSRKLRINDH